MKILAAILALLLVLVGVVIALGFRDEDHQANHKKRSPTTRTEPPAAAFGYARQEPDSTGMPALRAEATDGATPERSGRSLEAVLSEYWGPDWPGIRAKLLAKGVDLSQLVDIPSWEDVRERFAAAFELNSDRRLALLESKSQWPTELTDLWLREKFAPDGRELSAADLSTIRSTAEEHNGPIFELAVEISDSIARELSAAWRAGQFQRAPFSLVDSTARTPDKSLYYIQSNGYGWSVDVSLSRVDYPDLDLRDNELQRLVDRRDRIIRHRLREH